MYTIVDSKKLGNMYCIYREWVVYRIGYNGQGLGRTLYVVVKEGYSSIGETLGMV